MAFHYLQYSDEEINRIGYEIARDVGSGSYTLFDYLTNASRLPSSLLTMLTEVESQSMRRHFMRHFALPATPSGRIWKKCTFV